jgi:hypothetical protein
MAANPLKVLTDLFAKRQVVVDQGLVVSGSATGTTGLYVKQDAVIDGGLTVGGQAIVTGFNQIGVLQVDGTADVAGNFYLNGNMTATGSVAISEQLSVPKADVTKNLTIGIPDIFVARQQNSIAPGTPNADYVRVIPDLYVTPSGSYTQTQVTYPAIIDLNTVDSSYASGTMVINVPKALRKLDDFAVASPSRDEIAQEYNDLRIIATGSFVTGAGGVLQPKEIDLNSVSPNRFQEADKVSLIVQLRTIESGVESAWGHYGITHEVYRSGGSTKAKIHIDIIPEAGVVYQYKLIAVDESQSLFV